MPVSIFHNDFESIRRMIKTTKKINGSKDEGVLFRIIMQFGFHMPSLTNRIAASTSLKRVIRHNIGFKTPNGLGWFTNPKKAAYNKVYNKTSRGCLFNLLLLISFGVLTFSIPSCDFKKSDSAGGSYRNITN